MPRRRRALACCLVLAVTAGCAHSRRSDARSKPEPTIVVFRNESLHQADVYAVRDGGAGSVRLGTVMAGHTDTLTIPPAALPRGAGVDFVARLLARSRTLRSGRVTVSPGDRLALTLPVTENSLVLLPAPEP